MDYSSTFVLVRNTQMHFLTVLTHCVSLGCLREHELGLFQMKLKWKMIFQTEIDINFLRKKGKND